MAKKMLSPCEVAEALGVSESTIFRWRKERTGPPWHRIGPKLVRYSEAELRKWMDESKRSLSGSNRRGPSPPSHKTS